MKIIKWPIPFGMMGVFSFLLLDILGKTLWPGYNPVTTYVSTLLADEAPHVQLMRFFMNSYTICFLIFSFGMTVLSFGIYHLFVKLGYIIMLATALISVIGYGGYPISMALVFSKNDIIHVLVTVSILCTTALSILLIAIGYFKQERLVNLGRICLAGCLVFIAFNLCHLYVILSGIKILGLIERLSFYAFHTLTVILSWLYIFRTSELTTSVHK